MKHALIAGILVLSICSIDQSLGLDIDDSTSALNDRFANDASFIANDYDLSGIGLTSNGRWATLVSENVFVSAAHFPPGINSTVTFYQTNDPNGPSVTRTVTSGQQITGSDIWVGVLDSPVPVGYAVYDFATENITNETQFTNSVYHDVNAFMVGQSPFNTFTGTQDLAVGRNVLDEWEDSVNAAGTIDDAILATIDGEAQDVQYEATLVSGDSGAPLFVDLDENDNDFSLKLVGTNWFIGDLTPPPTDENGFTYLGNYDGQIQTIIDNNPVPEPGTMSILGLAGLALLLRRRRAC